MVDSNQIHKQHSGSRSSLTPSASNNPLKHSGRQALSSLPPSGKLGGSRASEDLRTNIVNQAPQQQRMDFWLDKDTPVHQLSVTSETLESVSARLSGHPSNNRGGKRIQNEQLAQPLTNQRQSQTALIGSTRNNTQQANEVPISNNKKQRKLKETDSSPGLAFRGNTSQALNSAKHSESLRNNQKIFSSGPSAYPKRATMKSSGLSASGGKSGPSAHISDMHKTSGSPSKAAKVANITYHQSVRSNNSQLDSRSFQTSTAANKKSSSRNSTTLINAGKTVNPVLSASNAENQLTLHEAPPQQYPTSNINSIVMQTSPAKFFKNTASHSVSLGSAQKTVVASVSLNPNAQQPQPEQPVINFSNFQNSSQNNPLRGTSGPIPNIKPQLDSVSIQIYGSNKMSACEVNQNRQPASTTPTQKISLFQSSMPQQHQQPALQQLQKGKATSINNICSTTAPSPNSGPSTFSKQQKHYSQVLIGNTLSQNQKAQSSITGAIPAKTEKTNSMSNLQMHSSYHGTAAAASNSAYGGASFGENQKKIQSGPSSSYGSTVAAQHSQYPVSININNTRSSTSPIRSQITMQAPQTGQSNGTANQSKAYSNVPHAEPTSKTISAAKAAGVPSLASGSGPKSSTAASRAKKELSMKQSKRTGMNNVATANLSFSYSGTSQGSHKQVSKKNAETKSYVKLGGSASKQIVTITTEAEAEYPNLPNLSRLLNKNGASTKDLSHQSQKSCNVSSTLRNSLSSQLVTPTPQLSSISNKSGQMQRKTNNWASPRQQQASSTTGASNTAVKLSSHLLNTISVSAADSILSEQIRSVNLDLNNQNVIRADTERARFISKDHQGSLQSMLTYFCKNERTSYKQGINDVMAPFLWLAVQNQAPTKSQTQTPNNNSGKKKKSWEKQQQLQSSFTTTESVCQLDLEEPYIMAREFIRTFQTNLFLDDDFNALQSCLALFKILLVYHDPIVAKHLENNHVTPELYCIPWFITYFAARMDSAQLVLEFWDRILQGPKDSNFTFIFFFAVSLVLTQREKILRCDQADLPQLMASLSIKSQQDLSQLIRAAEDLEDNTPFSFRYLEEIRSLFTRQTPDSLKQISQSLEQLTCMPIQPAELFFYAFQGEIECPNPACSNSLTWRRDRTGDYCPLAPAIFTAANSPTKIGGGRDHEDQQVSPGFGPSLPVSEIDDRIGGQSDLSSFANSFNSNSQVIVANPTHTVKKGGTGGHPLETESNLNYEQDHQESPIDLINETTKMKHLSSEDSKSFVEPQCTHSARGNSEISSDRLLQTRDNLQVSIENMGQQVPAEPQAPELCLRCQQRQRVMQQLEERRDPVTKLQQQNRQVNVGGPLSDEKSKDGGESSFEDLSTDLLYSKFRFIIVDCRLNILQQEVALPHCLSLEVLAASKAEQLKNQIVSLNDYKDSYHVCLLGLDQPEKSSTSSSQTGKISIRQFHEYVLCLVTTELVRQGFKYISTLPGGFQEVHDLAHVYGFQLIDHDEAHTTQALTMRQNIGDGCSQVDKDGLPIDCPITVPTTSNCYHCLATRNRRRTLEHQNSMVVKKYGSMVNTLTANQSGFSALHNSQSNGDFILIDNIRIDKAIASEEMMTRNQRVDSSVVIVNEDVGESDIVEAPNSMHETTAYNGQKFDLIGFSEYFPFGLKQVYAAASSSINQMLQSSKPEEEQKTQKPYSPTKNASKKTGERSLERLIGDMSRSRLRQMNLGGGQISRQQSTEHAYVGASSNFNHLAPNHLSSGLVRSAGKSSETMNRKAATFSGQQALPSAYKLHSKVPDFKSQFLISKDQTQRVTAVQRGVKEADADQQLSVNPSFVRLNNSFQASMLPARSESASAAHPITSFNKLSDLENRRGTRVQQENITNQQHVRADAISQNRISQLLNNQRGADIQNKNASPVRRNRPRINNEVQSQDKDIAQMLQKMQRAAAQGEKINEQPGPIMDENVPSKNVNRMNLGQGSEAGMAAPHLQPNVASSQAVMSFNQRRAEENRTYHQQSQNVQGTPTHLTNSTVTTEARATQKLSQLNQSTQQTRQHYHINSSYNGSSQVTSEMVTNQEDLPFHSHIEESYLLNGIVKQVPICKSDYEQLLSHQDQGHLFQATRLPTRKRTFQLRSQLTFNLQIDSHILITPFTVAIIQKSEDIRKAIRMQQALSENQLDSNMIAQYAVLQSRFFMYDLIKITSRKSTTKIITFYYRIPKKSEYDESVLEDEQIIWKLNIKPQCSYAFAFKRPEFEEVSMSFEFDREEDAKECIASVSSLYKQLKDSQKKNSRRSQAQGGTSGTQGQSRSGHHDRQGERRKKEEPATQVSAAATNTQQKQKQDGGGRN